MDDDGVGGTEAAAAVERVERRLRRSLGAWVAASTAGGAAALLCGHRYGRPVVRAFGVQTLLWAAVDAAVLVTGAAAGSRAGAPPAARLRKLLLVNSAADVGYTAVGAALAAAPARAPRWLRGRGTGADALRGHGLAVVVQGLALLVVDATAAAQLRGPRR